MSEVLSNAEMAEADRLTIAGGVPGFELMQHAGAAVAQAVVAACPPGADVAVVAGTGNNGGDGFAAARMLRERNYRPRVLLVGDAAKLKGDAAQAHRLWGATTEPAQPEGLIGAKIVVDALLGTGLDRPVEGRARSMIEAMNGARIPVVAVDLPSGISGDTGDICGAAVMAHKTVTFFRRKFGHLLLPGRVHCGEVRVADIGIRREVLARIAPRTFANAPKLWRAQFPLPRLDGHKYSRGHAVVISGTASFTGAARLAARGALRAGAGLVTIASPRDALAINATSNLAVMVRVLESARDVAALLTDRRLNAVAIGPGCGVGAQTRDTTLAVLGPGGANLERAVVVDADALTSFADDPAQLFSAVKARAPATTILTPHAGEFARLFGRLPDIAEVRSKLEQARRAAALSGAIIVLKGADTVIAAPDCRAAINENAPAWLATAGSGDVLAGFIAGLTAQGMPGFQAACAAVWLHGEAAREFGPGLISEDLPEALPDVYGRLYRDLGSGR
jgi:ADP-dependent NAD(P)H-hydrate dehydratase / NAD(P)H-hydrate epimerase